MLGTKDEEGRGRLSWGAWWEMSDEEDDVRTNVGESTELRRSFRAG